MMTTAEELGLPTQEELYGEDRCWLCGKHEVYESGLCASHYGWAEDTFPNSSASEDEIREEFERQIECNTQEIIDVIQRHSFD